MVGAFENVTPPTARARIRPMELTGDLLTLGARVAFWVAHLLALALAVWLAPWRQLREGPRLHLLAGAVVVS